MTSSIRAAFAAVFAASLAFACPLPALASGHIAIENQTEATVAVTFFEAWSGKGIPPTASTGRIVTSTCMWPHSTYSHTFSESIGEVRFTVHHANCAGPELLRDYRVFSPRTFTVLESGGRYTVH